MLMKISYLDQIDENESFVINLNFMKFKINNSLQFQSHFPKRFEIIMRQKISNTCFNLFLFDERKVNNNYFSISDLTFYLIGSGYPCIQPILEYRVSYCLPLL